MPFSNGSPPTSPSVLRELYRGRVRWDLLTPFPEPDPAETSAAAEAVGGLEEVLRAARFDADEVDRSGRLPDRLVADLQDAGLLRLMIEPALGGRGLGWFGACQVVEAAAARSMAVAFLLAIGNGFGSGVYLSALPAGPLRDLITGWVAAGLVSGGADAEPQGAANERRDTTALPIESGAAYLITGDKVYIGNAPIADLVDVSATLRMPDGTESVRLFFVDLRSPGVEVVARHEFMGLHGAAIGMLRLTDVRVPAENLMPQSSDGWRMRPGAAPPPAQADLGRLALTGRLMVVGPAAVALAKASLGWAREFTARRRVDGRPLAGYEEPGRLLDETAADAHLAESALQWALLGAGDVRPDLTAAKNITSLAAWRSVDRTVSMLGAEGYETAHSKAARGVPAHPVERAFRDARGLRVAGGVDEMLDRWSAIECLAGPSDQSIPAQADPPDLHPGRLRGHRRALVRLVQDFGETCASASEHGSDGLRRRQRLAGLLGRTAGELLGMAVVLARSGGRRDSDAERDRIADVACARARHQLATLRSELDEELERSDVPYPSLRPLGKT